MAAVESLVEERELKMVTFSGNGEPITRTGYFLKPTASFTDEASGDPPTLLLKPSSSSSTKVSFKGWRYPLQKWSQWVAKLEPLHKNLWKKTGIYDALKASSCVIIKQCPVLILALVEYWCPDTNTFVFPWSEATVTLEDVAILGGFSLIGEPARMMGPPTGEMLKSQLKMVSEHQSFNRRLSKKSRQSDWVNRYMEGECESEELEHIAFLSVWLSRHVFPAPPFDNVIHHVFPTAIRLAQGARIALAPSVLCSLYKDLKVLKNHSFDFAIGGGYHPLVLWGPFQILQLWTWERFLFLRPEEGPRLLHPDEPRAARWHNLCSNLRLSFIRSVLKSSDDFQWRPYTVNLGNWQRPSFYKDKGEWVCCNSGEDEEMDSFVRCLRPSELLGLDSTEQYLPQRVAMQFGLDQDIPCIVVRANSTWEVAWRTYDKPAEKVVFYVPPRLFESDVTLRYYNWRKDCMSSGGDSVKDALGKQDPLKYVRKLPKISLPMKNKPSPKAKKLKLQDDDHIPLSKLFGLDIFDFTTEEKQVKAHNPSSSSPIFQEQLTSITKEVKKSGRPRVTSECPSSSASVQQSLTSMRKRKKCGSPELSSNVSQTKETRRELGVGETSAMDPIDCDLEGITKDAELTSKIIESTIRSQMIKEGENRRVNEASTCVIIDDDEVEEVYTKKMKVGESAYNPIVIEDPKGKLPVKNNLTEDMQGLKQQDSKEILTSSRKRLLGLKLV